MNGPEELHDYIVDQQQIQNAHSHYIETEKGSIHKAHAINVALNKNYKCSNDRVFRVRQREIIESAEAFTNESDDVDENDDIFQTDPIVKLSDIMITIAKLKNGCLSAVVFSVSKIILNDKLQTEIKQSIFK